MERADVALPASIGRGGGVNTEYEVHSVQRRTVAAATRTNY
jgi:hypothetical protein